MHNKFDAIICDPPYGVKAGCKKTKPHQKKPLPTTEESKTPNLNEEEMASNSNTEESKDTAVDERMIGVFTRKENYGTNKIYDTLLNVASKFLKLGGRLVFLFHTDISYSPEHNEFPSHPCFKFIHSCENPLMTKRSRHSIKMIKIKEPDELTI